MEQEEIRKSKIGLSDNYNISGIPPPVSWRGFFTPERMHNSKSCQIGIKFNAQNADIYT